MSHTPTPYEPAPFELYESINGDDPAPFRIDLGNNVIAWCETVEGARTIVRACNAHDELVATLEDLVEQTTNYINYEVDLPDVTQARAVLAKVKEST